MKDHIFCSFTRKVQCTWVPSRDASSMSAGNCEGTFNQDNLREEVETCLFSTSLLMVMGSCCFYPCLFRFAIFLTLIKKAAFIEVLALIFINQIICGS